MSLSGSRRGDDTCLRAVAIFSIRSVRSVLISQSDDSSPVQRKGLPSFRDRRRHRDAAALGIAFTSVACPPGHALAKSWSSGCLAVRKSLWMNASLAERV